MIKQEIKDKLQLTKTNHHIGSSFRNNCEITFSELLNCYVADCDLKGEPLQDKYQLFNSNRNEWKAATLTEEFIEKAPIEEVIKFAKQKVSLDEKQ